MIDVRYILAETVWPCSFKVLSFLSDAIIIVPLYFVAFQFECINNWPHVNLCLAAFCTVILLFDFYCSYFYFYSKGKVCPCKFLVIKPHNVLFVRNLGIVQGNLTKLQEN